MKTIMIEKCKNMVTKFPDAHKAIDFKINIFIDNEATFRVQASNYYFFLLFIIYFFEYWSLT